MQINKLAAVLAFATSFSAIAVVPNKDQTVPKNVIYQTCGHQLFDQQSVLESKAYQDASDEQKGDMLEAEFNWKRRVCYGKELSKIAATLIPVSLIFYKAYFRFVANNNVAMGLGGGAMMFGAIGMFQPLISEITSFVSGKADSAKSIFFSIVSPSGNESIDKYERQYVRRKPFINKELQEILEENFISSRLKDDEHSRFSNDEKKSPVEFAKNVLALPTSKMEVVYDPARIEANLGTYNADVLNKLKRFAVRHAAASTADSVKKIVTYFQGPPGVGKTVAAEQLTDSMRVPFWVIKLVGKTVEDLEGTKTKPGLILEALIKAKYNGRGAKNMAIFFDEMDRALGMAPDSEPAEKVDGKNKKKIRQSDKDALLQFLLTLLEPGQHTFYSPYLGIHIDISSIGFMAAGNFDLTDPAFASRFEIVYFTGYSPEFKLNVVKTRIFGMLLAPYTKSKLPLTDQDFSQSDWQMIEDMVSTDKDPGFRTVLANLQNLMGDMVLCKHYNECDYRLKLPPKKSEPEVAAPAKEEEKPGWLDSIFKR